MDQKCNFRFHGYGVAETGGKNKSGYPMLSLQIVEFLESAIGIEKGQWELGNLLQWMKCEILGGKEEDNVFAVIGNDYGFQEAHKLVLEMAAEKDIPIQIEMVSKAGARVWSVAKMAGREFQDQSPARCALI